MSAEELMTAGLLLGSAYLIGSFPSALLIARRAGVDLRRTGSGNPGASNVYRTLGAGAGLFCLGLDIGKGMVAVLVAVWAGAGPAMRFAAGGAAVAGHMLSPFMGFRGGKGVATGGGVVLALAPVVGLVVIGVFALTLTLVRIVSVASVAAALALPVAVVALGEPLPGFLPGSVVVALVVVARHRSNLRRLVRGEETRFQLRRTKP